MENDNLKHETANDAKPVLGDVLCSVEVNNKESNYFRYRTCMNKAKYKIWYKYKGTSRTEGITKIVCERHRKLYEKEMEILNVENIA